MQTVYELSCQIEEDDLKTAKGASEIYVDCLVAILSAIAGREK